MNDLLHQILKNKRRTFAALLLPVLLLYFKSFYFGFSTLDEQWMILENAYLKKGWLGIQYAWTQAMAVSYYRPLLATSFHLDYLLGQLSPWSYHLTNLLLHLGCVLLLFRFLLLNRLSREIAFLLTLLFSAHPVLVHAVAWVPGRNDSMLCLFTLASLNALLKFFQTNKRSYLVPHFVFFVCALLTKESAIILPLIFTCYQLYYKIQNSKAFLPLIGAWAVLSVSWYLLRNEIVTPSSLGFSTLFFKNVIPGLMLYMGKVLYPVQQSVLPTLANSLILPGIVSTVILLLLAFKPGLRDKALAGLGLLLFFGLLLIPVWFGATRAGGEFYEHRVYTSMVGLILFVSQLKFDWSAAGPRTVLLLLFGLFWLTTWKRENVYKTENSFIMAGADEAPDFHLFPFQKSGLLFQRRQFDSALVCVNQAIASRKDKPQLFNNRGSIHFMLKRYPEALADYNEAIRLSPKFDPRPYFDRALVYCHLNQTDSAMQDLMLLKKCCQSSFPPGYEDQIRQFWKEQHPDSSR